MDITPYLAKNGGVAVEVDYRVPLAEMATLLVGLMAKTVTEASDIAMEEQRKTTIKTHIAAQKPDLGQGVLTLCTLTPYACSYCRLASARKPKRTMTY